MAEVLGIKEKIAEWFWSLSCVSDGRSLEDLFGIAMYRYIAIE
jgi:hypothetical protein